MGKPIEKLSEKIKYVVEDTVSKEKTIYAIKNKYSWYIHSSIKPVFQGRKFAKLNYKSEDYILIYGLGLGYHIKALLELMNKDQHLYVLETDLELYQCFLKHGVKEILNDNRLILMVTDSLTEVAKYLGSVPKSTEILYYEPLLKTVAGNFAYLKAWFYNYRLDMNASHSFKEMQENHDSNKGLGLPDFLELFEDKYKNVPCVIVSSGPSLLESSEYIKKLKGKAIIISVGRNVVFFEELGIEPTFYVEIDHQELVAKRFEGKTLKCPIVLLSSASNSIAQTYMGPKSIVFVRQNNTDTNVLEGGGSTVAATALELAIKLGLGPIGLIGQDLVFDEERTHFDNNAKLIITPSMSQVMCNDGVLRYTNNGFLKHKQSLNNVVNLISKDNLVFNLTLKGIKIENIPYLKKEVFEQKCSDSVSDIEKEIQSLKF